MEQPDKESNPVNLGSTIHMVNRKAVWILNSQDYRSSEKVFTSKELKTFLDTLQIVPTDYYHKALLQDSVPTLNNPNYEPKEYLSLKDYYCLFQDDYWYSYHGPHPFYLIAYKKYDQFSRFFVYHRNDYSRYLFIIHMGNHGKTVFNETIWAEGADGGNYNKISNSILTESTLQFSSLMGFYDEDEKEKNTTHGIEVRIEFDQRGGVKSRQETILKNN